jgi:uncharacterized protein YdiU (UPF0061 family)
MRVGFVHGVMNTDNMSILGLTIDYGPYGWLDDFDPHWTPNTTDAGGRRYRYAHQPAIAQWNLLRLADALRPLFADVAPLQAGMDRFTSVFDAEYEAMLAAKFGFRALGDVERTLVDEAHALLYEAEVDYTRFVRALGGLPDALEEDAAPVDLLGDVFYDAAKREVHGAAFDAWLRGWHARVAADGESADARRARMHAVNPKYVLRNYLAQEAIDLAEQGDASRVRLLPDVLRRPYDEQPEHERFAGRRPEWARQRAGCSMLSCSS